MPEIFPDLSEISEYKPREPGVYPAKVLSVTPATSKSGNPMLVIDVEFPDGGTKRTWLVTTGTAARGFDNFLRATGHDAYADTLRDPSVSPKPGIDTDVFIGVDVLVQIEADMYNGKPTDRIAGFMKA